LDGERNLRFKIQEAPSQPFDVEFLATFQNDDGVSKSVPGFYDGDNQFCVCFTLPKTGKWRYTTKSKATILDGLKGEITVQPPKESDNGGIVVDPKSSRRFAYESGQGYYPIAFECDWLFALDAENESDIPPGCVVGPRCGHPNIFHKPQRGSTSKPRVAKRTLG
jgi:Domain of unknown function (DUF5060)